MSDTPAGACASCGAVVTERYCAACGEEVLDAQKLTVRHFLTHSLVPEVVNVDGKIWRTLRYLLFRPAFLSLEYAAGRRRPYVGPLRVLLVAIVVYAFSTQGGLTFFFRFTPTSPALSLAPASIPLQRPLEDTLLQIDRFGVLERMFAAKMGPVNEAPDEVRSRFNTSLRGFATPVSFVTVLLLAMLLYVLFRRRRTLFVEHAVFTLHAFSFVLLSSLVGVIVIKLGLLDNVAVILLTIGGMTVWQAAYLAVGLRRFYWQADRRRFVPHAQAAGVAVLLYFANGLFITVIQLLGGAIAIWRL